MVHSIRGQACGCVRKTVKSLDNACHTWALLQWGSFIKRRYIKLWPSLSLRRAMSCSWPHPLPPFLVICWVLRLLLVFFPSIIFSVTFLDRKLFLTMCPKLYKNVLMLKQWQRSTSTEYNWKQHALSLLDLVSETHPVGRRKCRKSH